MSTFGIKAYLASSTPSYFVGEDERLWEWIHEDNGVPIGIPNMVIFPNPPGYKFMKNTETGVSETEAEGFLITTTEPTVDKAVKALEVLNSVEEEEFAALNLPSERTIVISV